MTRDEKVAAARDKVTRLGSAAPAGLISEYMEAQAAYILAVKYAEDD